MLIHEEDEDEEESVKIIFTCTSHGMFSTLMSLEDRRRLKLKGKIIFRMVIRLDHPWQSLYKKYYIPYSVIDGS